MCNINYTRSTLESTEKDTRGRPLAYKGILTILNQVKLITNKWFIAKSVEKLHSCKIIPELTRTLLLIVE